MTSTTTNRPHAFQAFYSMVGPSANERRQTVKERYAVPENFLEVEVKDPMTHGTDTLGNTYPLFTSLLITRYWTKNVYGL